MFFNLILNYRNTVERRLYELTGTGGSSDNR